MPRDVIEWQLLTDEPSLTLDIGRGGLDLTVDVARPPGAPLGVEVHSALFDQVRTCDNHCEFCFIYQLPPGLRRSLYLKDDDYRLSFLYGNFTTLTRFTEADLERVVTERLSPLNVTIHATDPDVRAEMLRNRRGATSLRWLRALLDHGIEVHGQVVVCPGVNDGAVLDDTLAGVLDQYPELATLCVVPARASAGTTTSPACGRTPRPRRRPSSTASRTGRTCSSGVLGRRLVFAADEYYLLAGRPFPAADATRASRCTRTASAWPAPSSGSSPAGSPSPPARRPASSPGSTAPRPRRPTTSTSRTGRQGRAVRRSWRRPRRSNCGRVVILDALSTAERCRCVACPPVGILTGSLRARVLEPLVAGRSAAPTCALLPVANEFFGGNIGVTGLLVGEDLARVLAGEPTGHRYLLPDVCLSQGRFLDGTTPADLPRPVEIVPTDGIALRRALVR